MINVMRQQSKIQQYLLHNATVTSKMSIAILKTKRTKNGEWNANTNSKMKKKEKKIEVNECIEILGKAG